MVVHSYWIMTNSASLKKTVDCRGEDVQGYLQRTHSKCLHVEESEKRVEDKEEMVFEV